MPLKSLGQVLDVKNDFVRPSSMTLTSEELRGLPSAKGKLKEPMSKGKLIMRKLESIGMLKNSKRSEHANRAKLDPSELVQAAERVAAERVAGPERVKTQPVKQFLGTLPKGQLLKPPLLAHPSQIPKFPYNDDASLATVHDLSSFSPHSSPRYMPSPIMRASLSSPEYTNSEDCTSGDEFSEMSSPVASLVLEARPPKSLVVPCKLKKIGVHPQIFEFSSDDKDEDISKD